MALRGKLVLQVGAIVLVGLLIALLGWRLAGRQEGVNLASQAQRGERPASPDFTLPTLAGDEEVTLSSFRGKPVVLNFWASWCVPCREEAAAFRAAHEKWGDRVVFIGVDAQDFVVDARKFVERYGVEYTNVHDGSGSTLGRFGITGFPETLWLDAEGRIVAFEPGQTDAEAIERNIRLALGA
jgi:cytochrome c biogenesis protein CcmG/thiol:disulfide interchange protein DsbE